MQYTALSRTQQCPPRATTPELPQDAPSRSALTDSRFTITDDRLRRLAPVGSDPSATHARPRPARSCTSSASSASSSFGF